MTPPMTPSMIPPIRRSTSPSIARSTSALRSALRAVLRSRVVLALGVLVSVAVPVLTLPSLPHVSLWPLALGLAPWVVGKYLLCPLRWRSVTPGGGTQTGGPSARLTRSWHVRAYAEGELLGLLTPGHVGADLWRFRRLTRAGLVRGDAILSVGTDRLVGALGLTAFVAFAGAALPLHTALLAGAVALVALLVALGVRVVRPDLLPRRPLPPWPRLVQAFALSAGYQLSIAALLMGAVAATGHELSPLALLGAFGASQVAGAVPGPNGASPRDGALVVALVALGIPWSAALAAVAVKAAVAWLPALALGGVSLLFTRRALRATVPAPVAS